MAKKVISKLFFSFKTLFVHPSDYIFILTEITNLSYNFLLIYLVVQSLIKNLLLNTFKLIYECCSGYSKSRNDAPRTLEVCFDKYGRCVFHLAVRWSH